ncbi:MAG: hypothetical protein ACJAS4_002460 [Bacteriovoracaceae bacterium]|jgi:hypothetical protein
MRDFKFKYILLSIAVIFLHGCSSEIEVDFVEIPLQSKVIASPVVTAFAAPAGMEDLPHLITLNYSDPKNRLATSCYVSNLSNITETTACSCTISGTCTVGVTGLPDYNGSASFKYTVLVDGTTSNSATVNFTLIPVDDPYYITNFDDATDWTISGALSWECGDQTNDSFGPPSGHSGNTVCGTVLNGDYTVTNSIAYIESPIITLTDAISPRVSFWMDNEIEINSCGADYVCDGLSLSISVNSGSFVPLQFSDTGLSGLLPDAYKIGSGAGTPAGWSNTQPAGEWGQVNLDLFSLETTGLTGIVAGDTIVVRFALHTDASSGGPGTYIDDFEVSEFSPEVKSLPYTQNFDTVDGWFASGGGNVWEIGNQTNATFGPASGYSGNTVAATKLNADYIINPLAPSSTRFIDSYLNSPPMTIQTDDNPAIRFWFYNDSEVNSDGSNVQISVNGGAFITIGFGDFGFSNTYTNNGNMAGLDGWSGVVAPWQEVVIELLNLSTPGLNGITKDDEIRVRFLFHADRDDSNHPGTYIDDFTLYSYTPTA